MPGAPLDGDRPGAHVDPADARATATIRYWAGARAAVGQDSETVLPGTVGELTAAASGRHTGLERVIPVASFLLEGMAVGPDVDVPAGATLEVLPPFAGG